MTDEELAKIITEVVAKEVKAILAVVDVNHDKVLSDIEKIRSDILDSEVTLLENAIEQEKKQTDALVKTDDELTDYIDNKFEYTKTQIKTINLNVEDLTEKSGHTVSPEQLSEVAQSIDNQMTTFKGAFALLKKDSNDSLIAATEQEFNAIKSNFHKLELEHKIYMQDELMRMNDVVNSKLAVLKGEPGEKGDTGNDGGVGDGIDSLSIDCGCLSAKLTSGKTFELGRVAPDHKGEFDEIKTYQALDIVTKNGTTFISVIDNNSDHPPGNNWKALATKGAKGNKGELGKTGLTGAKGDAGEINPADVLAIIGELK